MPRRLGAGVAVALLLAACGPGRTTRSATTRPTASSTPPPSSAPSTTLDPHTSEVATAAVPAVPVFAAPGQPDPVSTLENPTKPYNTPLVFLVTEESGDWLHVLLPIRPNGSTGWIRESDVTLTSHNFRILVELGAHRITVWQGDQIFDQEPIGVGTTDTPTPGGMYYTKELLQPIDSQGRPLPNGPYGPYAYGLSGYSDVLYNFAGGDGVIGIHGTNDPSSLGHNASHGCIRMSNEGITKLANTLPIGVPVEIRA